MVQAFMLLAATASSTLAPSKSATYAADNAFDGNPETAWCEGVEGDGVGQSLTVELGDGGALGSWAGLSVEVYTGYQKNHESYRANGRPVQLRVELLAGDQAVAHSTLRCPGQSRCSGKLAAPAQLSGLVRLRLSIEKVERGARFHDTCISEVLPSLPSSALRRQARAVAARFCQAVLRKDAAALRELTDEPPAKVRAALSPEVGDHPEPTCKPDAVSVRAADAFDLYQIEYGGGGASYRRFVRSAGRWRALRGASYFLDL